MWWRFPTLRPIRGCCLNGIVHRTTFVNYLRVCFRCGGLPGLERKRRVPARDRIYLTRDLLPL
jgi:hypothetical protein